MTKPYLHYLWNLFLKWVHFGILPRYKKVFSKVTSNSHNTPTSKPKMMKHDYSKPLLVFFLLCSSALLSLAQTDIQLTKTVDDNTPDEGENVTFTITVKNFGASATAISISDVLPANMTYVSHVASQGIYDPVTGLWNVGALNHNKNKTLTITAYAVSGTSGTTITNTVNYVSSTPTDNNASNNSASASVTVNTTDLSMAKTVSNNNPNQGNTISYTLSLSNAGPSFASNIVVTDTIPAGVTFVNVTGLQAGTWNYDGLTRILTWNIPSQLASVTRTLTYTATVNAGTATQTILNSAYITALSQADNNSANNHATRSITVKPQDIRVTKSAPATADENSNIVYTITATNISGGAYTALSVSDTLPANVTYVSYTADAGIYDPVTGIWDAGALADGASKNLYITAKINSGTSGTNISNTAQYLSSTPPDQVPGNNSASASTAVNTADLSVLKTVSNSTPNQLQTISYTIRIANGGAGFAGNIVVRDTIPLTETFVTVTTLPSGTWYYDAGNRILTWNIPSLPNGNNQSLVYTATVNTGTAQQIISNTAFIHGFDQVDNNTANNSSSVSVTVRSQDVSVTKSVSDNTPDEYSNIIYTITATNLSGGDLSALSVSDNLPAQVTYVSYTADAGTYNPVTGIWDVGALADQASKNLYITVNVNGNTSGTSFSNTATYLSSTPADQVPANNSASVSVTVNKTDLALLKTVNDATPNQSQAISYTLRVTNAGPSAATNIEVIDTITTGLTFGTVTTLPSGTWSYDASTRIFKWNIPSLAVTNTSLVFTATVNSNMAGQTIRNTGIISGVDQVETNTANNSSTVNVTVNQQDIRVTKTVDDNSPDEFSNIIYTISATNLTGGDVTGLIIADTLPAQVTFVSYTADTGAYNHVTGIWNIGNLRDLATKKLYITASVKGNTSGTSFSNTAKYVSSAPIDQVPANNNASVSVTVNTADLRMQKTVSDATPNAGSTISYTLKLTNNGPSVVTNVVVQDTLPAGLTFGTVTTLPSGSWSYDAPTRVLRWEIPSFAVTNQSLVFTATVDIGTSGQTISNMAAITDYDQVESNPNNNKSTVSITVNVNDIRVQKSVNVSTADEFSNIVYTVTASNLSGGDVANLNILDTLPSRVTFVSYTAEAGTYDPLTGIWNVGNLADLAVKKLFITASVNGNTSGSTIVNTARYLSSSPPDAVPGNNSGSASVTINTADLRMQKTVDDNTPDEGQNIVYSLRLTNSGPSIATNIAVKDTLPVTLTYVSATAPSGTWAYDAATRVFTWNVPSAASAAVITLQLTVKVNSGTSNTTINNAAVVAQYDQLDPLTTNNRSSVSVTVNTIDINVVKTVNDNTADEGQTLSFSLRLTNDGPGNATNVVITDTLPASMTFGTVTTLPTGTWTYDAPTRIFRWTVPSIAITNRTLIYTATVNTGTSGTSFINRAHITAYDAVDETANNNSSAVTINVNKIDLGITKTVDENNPAQGATVAYTMKISNDGPGSATNILIHDTIPAGLTFVNVSSLTAGGGTWSYNAATRILSWSIPSLGVTDKTMVFTATVNPDQGNNTITNGVNILSYDQSDLSTTNNKATVSLTVKQQDVQVTKTVNNNTPDEGNNITYTINVRNTGGAISALSIADTLPAGVTYVSHNAEVGTYTPATGIWNVGALGIGAAGNKDLTITVKINTGTSGQTITNTAKLYSVSATDNVPANNNSAVSVTVNTADVSMTKTVNDASPDIGQLITYSLRAANNGPANTATNAVVTDTLPAGLTFGSITVTPAGTTASYNATNRVLTWNIPSLVSGSPKTLQFTSTVNTGTAAMTITNTARIRSDQQDLTSSNNASALPVIVNGADLQLTKSVDKLSGIAQGDTLTYTITLTNNGPLAANGVRVQDVLSNKLTMISATPSKSTYVNGIWGADGLMNMNAGTSATLVIKAKVNTGTSRAYIINTATITQSSAADAVTSNNTATVSSYVHDADLQLTKTVDKPSPVAETDTLVYTITVKNNGLITARDIKITDNVPANLTYITSSATKSLYSHITGVWGADNNIDLVSGDSAVLTIWARVNSGTSGNTFTNTAAITYSSQPDSITSNNSASVASTVGAADIQVTKTVNKTSPVIGDTLIYTIKVKNLGPEASVVRVQDILPAGLTYISSTATESSYNPATGMWGTSSNISLNVNETQTLTIRAKVNTGTTGTAFINTATMTYSKQGDGNSSNNSASVTSAVGSADLAITNTVSGALFNPGDPVTYTITLSNNGPGQAAGFYVKDLLPAGITFTNASANLGSYNATTGNWTFGASTLPAGNTATLTILGRIAPNTGGMRLRNIATIFSTQSGNVIANDTASNLVQVHGADLVITQTVHNQYPVEGGSVNYTITLRNDGPDTAKNIQVTDDIPLSLQFMSFTASKGTYSYNTNLWTGLTLAPGESATLNLYTLMREAQQITNVTRITASSQPDGTVSNNSAFTSVYGSKFFAAGAAIIDMGVTPQTYNNGLKPYGLIYDLVTVKQIPVYWAINPNKTFVNPSFKQDLVDFTVAGKNYRAGAFIIPAEFIPSVLATINSWIAASPGMTVDFNRPAFTAPIHAFITSFPRAVLDAQNGDKIQDAFYLRSGISASSYRNDGAPSNLDVCDDIYAMPHADPQNWDQQEKDTLSAFINFGGWMWAACHAVSAIETLVDINNDGIGDMNYLSNEGLVPWNQHDNGEPAYEYNVAAGLYANNLASDPFMQFIGTFDGALQNGSEQIFIPYAAGWRSSTVLAITDADQPEVLSGEYIPGPAAALAYGNAYGDPFKGMLMYQASHSIAGGTEAQNVSSARVYGNFLLEAGVKFKPEIATDNLPNDISAGTGTTFSVIAQGKALPLMYTWSSDCGGTFSNPNSNTTIFTPPSVLSPTSCIIRVSVTDQCGRKNFIAQLVTIFPESDLSIQKTASANVKTGGTIQYTLKVKTNNISGVPDAYVRDTLPAGLTGATYKLNGGPSLPWPASDSVYIGPINAADSAMIVITATVGTNVCSPITNRAYTGSSNPETDPDNNMSSVTTAIQDSILPVMTCPAISTTYCSVASVPARYTSFNEFISAGGSAGDNCALDSASFAWVSDAVSGNTLTRTYSIRDITGNLAICAQPITVYSSPSLALTAGPDCASNQSTYEIELSITSGTAPFTASATLGTASVSGNTVTVADITSGIGSVITVTDANSCQATYSKTPYYCGNCPVTSEVINSNGDNTICAGETIQISATVSGGVNPYSYAWSPNIGTGAGPFTVSPAVTTTYQLIVTDDDNNGCSDTSYLTITVNDVPSVTASASQSSVCRTQSSVLSYGPTAGLTTIGWFQADGSCSPTGSSLGSDATLTASPSSTTTYAVMVQNASGCVDTACVTLNITDCSPVAIADYASVNEDGNTAIAVLSNDDFGGNGASSGTITITTAPSNGTASVNDNGTPNDPTDDQVSYTPSANYNGPDMLIYEICDSDNDCDTAVVYITVNAVNDLPVAEADNAVVNEDAVVAIDVLANDDFGGDGPANGSIILIDNGVHGSAAVDDNGTPNDPSDDSFIYTPAANYNGSDEFIYQICDANGDCDTAIVLVTVNSVDDLPVANADNASVDEDANITIAVLSNDDFGGDGPSTGSITIIAAPSNGTAVVNDNGTPNDPSDDQLTYTPSADYHGNDQLVYQICDADNDCDTAIVSITVNSVDDQPVANADFAEVDEDAGTSIPVLGNDDFGGDGPMSGTIVIISTPINGTASVNDGGTPNDPTDDEITYTPNANYNGPDVLIYQLCDADVDCDTAIVYITVNTVNDLPVANADNAVVDEDASIMIAVLPNDDFGGDGPMPMEISIVSNPLHGTATVDDNGTPADPADDQVIYVPGANYNGPDVLIYQICDADNDCDTAIIRITVNSIDDFPVADADYGSVGEDAFISIAVLANDNFGGDGPSAGAITVIQNAVNGNANVDNNGTPDNPADDAIIYAPDVHFNGSDIFIYQICDADNDCDTAIVYVDVVSVNDPPVVPDTTVTIPEDATITVCLPITDPDIGDTHTVTLCGGPYDGILYGGPTVIGNEVCFDYQPNKDFNGIDSVCLVVCDIAIACDTSITIILVTPQNDPPVVEDTTVTIPEDSTITVCLPIEEIDINDTHTSVLCGGPSNGTITGPSVNGGEVCITYTPNTNWHGTDSICIITCDNSNSCDTTIITIIVTPVNDPPVVPDTTVTIPEDSTITVCLPITDVDTGEIHTVTLCGGPYDGILYSGPTVIGNEVCFSYQPNKDFNGIDSVCLVVCDIATACDTSITIILVTPQNDPPVVEDTTVTIPEDSTITVCLPIDEIDINDTHTSTVCGNPTNGTITGPTVNSGEVCITYTPNTNWHGTDSVCIITCDNSNSCDTTIITIIVTTVNDPPVVPDTTVTIPEDSTITVCLPITDVDTGEIHTVTLCGGPYDGILYGGPTVIGNEVCFSYQPNKDFNGIDSVCLVVCDIATACDTSITIILVTPQNDPPVVEDTTVTLPEDSTITVCLPIDEIDVNDTHTSTVCGNPTNGTITGPAVSNGEVCIIYTPNTNWHGTDSICIITCDNQNGCDTTIITIIVTPVNDPPVVPDTTVTIPEDSTITVCLPITDVDTGEIHTVTLCGGPYDGILYSGPTVIGNEVCFSYQPNKDFNGIDSVCLVVCDIATACDTSITIILVTPQNDPPVVEDTTVTIPEDSTITVCLPIEEIDVNDTHTSTVCGNPTNGTITGPAVSNGEVCIIYTPNTNWHGTDSICIITCDNQNGCDTTIITIIVTPVNDPPVVPDTTVTIPEDSTITVCLPITDVDTGEIHTVTLCGGPYDGILYGGPTVIGNEVCFDYQPNKDFNGIDSVCLVVCDIATACDTSITIILVTPQNDPPVVEDTTVTIPEDSTITVCLPIEEIDVNDTHTSTVCGNPTNGTITGPTVNGGEVCITYIPNTNWYGTDSVCIITCDNSNGCDTTIITIIVTPVNDPPVVPDTTVTIPEDSTITVCLPITDVDTGEIHTVTLCGGPYDGILYSGPTVIGNEVCFSYQPNKDFNGIDSVCLVVCDIATACDTSITIILVTPQNDPPVVEDTTVTIPEDSTITVCLPIEEIDINDTHTSVICGGPSNGTITGPTVNGGEVCIIYTPNTNWHGTDSICIITCDNQNGCDTTIITIIVTPVNDPPVVPDTTVTIPEDSIITVCIPVTDPDAGDSHTAGVCEAPHNGTLTSGPTIVNGELCLTYEPNPDFNGRDSVCIIVCDAANLCDTSITIIIVIPENDPPVAIQDNASVCGNSSVVIDVLSNDQDGPDGQLVPGSVTQFIAPAHGSISINTITGAITYTPNTGYSGLDQFAYSVCDNGIPMPAQCDTAMVYVQVNSAYSNISIDSTICQGETVTIGGNTYGISGDYQVSFTTANGCDSIVNLHLTVNPVKNTDVRAVLCFGEQIIAGGQLFTTSVTDSIIVLSTSQGCDSIITVNIQVLSQDTVVTNRTICAGESVEIGDSTFTQAGTYFVPFQNNQCTGIIQANITVNQPTASTINAEICAGDIYNVAGQVFATAGTHTITIDNSQNCDSVITLNLVVNQETTSQIDSAICRGESVTIGTQTFTATGSYDITLQTSKGCDTTIHLNLIVLDNGDTTHVAQSICEGDSVVINSQVFNSTGQYYINSPNGRCNNTIALNLTVRPVSRTSLAEAICQGSAFVLGGQTFTSTGIYTITLQNSVGCDSIITLDLDVSQGGVKSQLDTSICQGSTLTVGGQTFNTTGIYQVIYPSGICRDTLMLNLTVNPSYFYVRVDSTICEGELVIMGGNTYELSGDYSIPLTTSTGCDSIVNLVLTVNPVKRTNVDAVICFGDQVVIGSQTYTASVTNEIITLQAASGCDSMITLNLVVLKQDTIVTDRTICRGETIDIGGNYFTDAGTYYIPFQNDQCMGIAQLNLSVNEPTALSIDRTICEGSTVMIAGQVYSTSGTYTITTTNAQGCDSVITLNLTVSPTINTDIDTAICRGQTFTVGTTTFNLTGNYTVNLTGAGGCDSVVHLQLLVIPAGDTGRVSQTICANESIIVEGQEFDQPGVYYIATSNGNCVNWIELTLHVKPVSNTSIARSICRGESVIIGNHTFTTTGVYVITLQNAAGCDSIVTLDLNVSQGGDKIQIDTTVCSGGSVTIAGQTFTQTGTYQVVYPGTVCRDTLVVNLTVNNRHEATITRSICVSRPDSLFWEGQWYNTPGLYTVSYTSSKGCDSILHMSLQGQTFCQQQNFDTLLIDTIPITQVDTVCVPLPGATNVEVLSCTGTTNGVGNYGTWTLDPQGCLYYTAGTVKGTDTLCVAACDTLSNSCITTTVIITVTGLPPVANNDSVYTVFNTPVVIPVLNNDQSPDEDTLKLCDGNAIITSTGHGTVTTNPDGTITYTPTSGFEGVDSFQYAICDPEGGDLAWVIITISNCQIPNGISPNGDGINESFIIPCASGPVFLDIFNRWGMEVFRSENYDNSWDGTYKGAPLPDGTYYYVLRYTTTRGEQINHAAFVVIHR